MDEKIGWGEKMGFALTNLGNIPIMTLLNTYLLIFYTDVIEVDPAIVGGLFLVSRMLDGISDPLLGFLVDRFPTTKRGKYKPVLILGVILCCINYLFVWFSPVMFPAHKIIVISISYILLGITFDLMDIPLNSLIPVLTKDEKQRNQLSSIKGISYTVGPTLLNVVAPLAIASSAKPLNGYLLLIIGTVLVVLFFTIVGALMVKERVTVESSQEISQSYSIKEAWPILKLTPVVTLFAAMLCITAATNIFNGSLLFYLNYVLKNPKLLSFASFVGLFCALLAGIIVPKLSEKWGKTSLYFLSLLGMCLLLVSFMLMKNQVAFICLYGALQFALGVTNTLQYSISADNVDLIREKLGIEATALVASFTSLIMKFAMAVGGAIPGFVLSFSGYVANQGQSHRALQGILFVTFGVPFILYFLTALIFRRGFKSKFSSEKLDLKKVNS